MRLVTDATLSFRGFSLLVSPTFAGDSRYMVPVSNHSMPILHCFLTKCLVFQWKAVASVFVWFPGAASRSAQVYRQLDSPAPCELCNEKNDAFRTLRFHISHFQLPACFYRSSSCWLVSIDSTTQNTHTDCLVLEVTAMVIEGQTNNCEDSLFLEDGKPKFRKKEKSVDQKRRAAQVKRGLLSHCCFFQFRTPMSWRHCRPCVER